MVTPERRKSPRGETNVLASLKQLEDGTVKWSGFAKSLNLSAGGVLLESPDPFRVEQTLTLEFLLDEDKVVQVHGTVKRVNKSKGLYRVAIEFLQASGEAKRLIAKQVKA